MGIVTVYSNFISQGSSALIFSIWGGFYLRHVLFGIRNTIRRCLVNVIFPEMITDMMWIDCVCGVLAFLNKFEGFESLGDLTTLAYVLSLQQ